MKVDFTKRSTEIEIMDDLDCKGEVVDQTLHELDVINQWLGGDGVTVNAVKDILKNSSREYSIVDLGCGSGKMLRLLSDQALKQNKKVKLIGIDANPNIVRFAIDHSVEYSEIEFKTLDIFSEEFKKLKFDIVLATLFLHHFNGDQLVNVFSGLKNQMNVVAVVNDLHRHPLAYYSFKMISTLFSKSAMVKFDGPLSVLRAFKRKDLEIILEKAGITNYSLKWKWAFRWQLIIYK